MVNINNKEIRTETKEILKERRGRAYALALLPPLLAGMMSGLLAYIHWSTELLGAVLAAVIAILTSVAFLSLAQGGDTTFKGAFLDELSENGLKYAVLSLIMSTFVFLWSMLLVVPGIIKQVAYSMAPFIAKERSDLNANECITLSREIMDGHKWTYTKLHLSYYGAIYGLVIVLLVSGLTLLFSAFSAFFPAAFGGSAPEVMMVGSAVLGGIALLVITVLSILVVPRWHIAKAVFYMKLKKKNNWH